MLELVRFKVQLRMLSKNHSYFQVQSKKTLSLEKSTVRINSILPSNILYLFTISMNFRKVQIPSLVRGASTYQEVKKQG